MRRGVPGGGHSKGKGPEVGKSVGFWRNSEKAGVAGAGEEKGARREISWGGWRLWATLGVGHGTEFIPRALRSYGSIWNKEVCDCIYDLKKSLCGFQGKQALLGLGVDVGAASGGDGRAWSGGGPGCKEVDAFCICFRGGAGETRCRVSCGWRLRQGVEAGRHGSLVNEEAWWEEDQVEVRGHQDPGVAMCKFQEH